MPRSLLCSRSSQQEEMSCKNHVWMRHQNFRPQGPRIPNITELMIGSQRPLQSSLSASSLPGFDWYLNGRLWANCSQGQIRVGSIRKRIPDASKQKLSNVLVLTARDTQEKKTHAPRWVLIFPGAWGCSSGSMCFCCSEWRENLSSWHCSVRTTYILCKPFLTEILYPSKPEAIYSISPNKSAPWLPSGFPHTPVFEHLSRHWCLGWLWKEEVEPHWRKFYSLAIKSSASCAHYNVTRQFSAPVAMCSLSVMPFSPWWALVLWNRKPR